MTTSPEGSIRADSLPAESIRIASYNTRDFLDDRRAAARVVRAIDPDVLCLQEVPRRLGSRRRVAQFAADCGMRWVGRHRGSGGTTIFVSARVSLRLASHHRLAVALLDRTRGYAVAQVSLDSGLALTVVSLHLGLRAMERERHLEQILGALGPVGEVVVAGDLNELADGPVHRRLGRELRLVSPQVPTFPARRPRTILDVIFASAGLRVVDGAMVTLDEADLVAASDHRPVWVDLASSRRFAAGS